MKFFNMEQQTSNYLNSDQQSAYVPTSDERTMAILSHILAFVSAILAPLIIYLIKKDQSKYVAEHAKESLNFQITMFICYIISMFLMIILIGVFLLIALGIFNLVVVIIASIKASENTIYRYPFNLRLIK